MRCAAQVWQAVLTKPIDLDSARIRQQMSDGARSLLKVLLLLLDRVRGPKRLGTR